MCSFKEHQLTLKISPKTPENGKGRDPQGSYDTFSKLSKWNLKGGLYEFQVSFPSEIPTFVLVVLVLVLTAMYRQEVVTSWQFFALVFALDNLALILSGLMIGAGLRLASPKKPEFFKLGLIGIGLGLQSAFINYLLLSS